MRIEPPISDPVAKSAVPAASVAPAPPEEPPGVKAGFQGLRVTPCSFEWQTAAQENSGVVVRACTIPPARITRAFTGEVCAATKSFVAIDPLVVTRPLI